MIQSRQAASLHFGAVILGAGRSERMGRPKLLLPWGQTTVLGRLLEQWNGLAAKQVAVVCARDAHQIQDELDRLGFPKNERIDNPAPERGMFSSIQCAAEWPGWKTDLTHWMITLGDQPHLREATLRALLECGAANPDKICQPIRGGRTRHPVLLPKQVFKALVETSTTTLKLFLQGSSWGFAGFDSDDPGLDLDLDTPADYRRAQELYWDLKG